MQLPVLYLDDNGLLFDDPMLVSPMYRWRLVPLYAKDGFPIHDETWFAFYEYEGEHTARMLVQFEKDWTGHLINPVIAGTSRKAI